jgi:CheY-like chemotaxis protein
MPDQPVILLAEDREDDIVLIRGAFKKGGVPQPTHIVRDGEEVIAYLAGYGKYANRSEYPLPDLLLLDLKMPRLDGFDVLNWIKKQPGLRALRVVVLTSSEHISDVNRAYNLGANSFLVKPQDFDRFQETCYVIKNYWLSLITTPRVSRPSTAEQPTATTPPAP